MLLGEEAEEGSPEVWHFMPLPLTNCCGRVHLRALQHLAMPASVYQAVAQGLAGFVRRVHERPRMPAEQAGVMWRRSWPHPGCMWHATGYCPQFTSNNCPTCTLT